MIIRAIQQKDNAQIANVIRAVFHELDRAKSRNCLCRFEF